MKIGSFAAGAAAMLACASSAAAQVTMVVPSAVPVAMLHIPEGTEVRIRFEDTVTSKTAHAGDQFVISVADDIELPGGVTIPAGAKGMGEVVSAERHGFIGKAGQLNVSVDYIKIGEKRVHIRANKGGEGKGSLGSAVALTVLFGPLGLLARGADMTIPVGQKMTAYVEADTDIPAPANLIMASAPSAPAAPAIQAAVQAAPVAPPAPVAIKASAPR